MTQAPSFGVRLAGLPVRLPAGTPLEYVAQASLYPLPLASKRVAGLMQLRGQPLVVLDASANEATAAVALAPHDVLVVGTLPNAAALLVDGAPQPVAADADALGLPLARVGTLADCPFFDAIVSHRVAAANADGAGDAGDAGEGAGGVTEWYDVDPSRLFAALLAD